MLAEKDIWPMAKYAALKFSPWFGLEPKPVDVALQKPPKTTYLAVFDHRKNLVFIDPKSYRKSGNEHFIHTIGEEVGHGLHFRRNPKIFDRSNPPIEETIASIKNGTYKRQCYDYIVSRNLVEFVGHLLGLELVADKINPSIARKYARVIEDYYRGSTFEKMRPFIVKMTEVGNDERALEMYEHDPENMKENADNEMGSEKAKEVKDGISCINHCIGYFRSAELFVGFDADVRRRAFNMALECESAEEFDPKLEKLMADNHRG